MTHQEACQYWFPARDNVGASDVRGSRDLAKLLGYKYPVAGYHAWIKLPPNLKNVLRGLAGPNKEFVLKVLETQRK